MTRSLSTRRWFSLMTATPSIHLDEKLEHKETSPMIHTSISHPRKICTAAAASQPLFMRFTSFACKRNENAWPLHQGNTGMNACDAMAERTRSVSPHLASLTVHQRTADKMDFSSDMHEEWRCGETSCGWQGNEKRSLMLDALRRQKDMDYDNVVQVMRIDGVVFK